MHVLLFDYRHFGDSDGKPRQLVSVRRQLQDYAAAVAFARALSGVDPARIAVWARRSRRACAGDGSHGTGVAAASASAR